MRNRKHLNEDFDIMGSLHSAARSFLDLPIVKRVTSALPGGEDSPEDEEEVGKQGGKRASKEDLAQSLETAANESVPLSIALDLDTDKSALIIGSSQAGVVGYPVMKLLEGRGFKEFKFDPTPAKTMRYVFSYAAAVVKDRSKYDVIVIFPGYRYGEDPDTVEEIVNLFTPGRCFVVAPPPVTTVTNPLEAAKLGLNKGNPVQDNYWFKLRGGKYAAEREDFCKRLESLVSNAGATYIDPRDLNLGGEMQESGIQFPNSPDGIHPAPAVIDAIAMATIDAIFECTLPINSVDILSKITPELLERRPDIARKLDAYKGISGILAAAKGIESTGRYGSGFGPRKAPTAGASTDHKGVDIGLPIGTNVRAIMDGTVQYVGLNSPTAGNYIEVMHDGGVLSRYIHGSEILAKKGERVKQGQVIMLSGNTGVSTGPHLHFAINVNGRPVDPVAWLDDHDEAITPVKITGREGRFLA
jgi:murein DD-endopeptidase MepM/ murein hydrolase activator NlpD